MIDIHSHILPGIDDGAPDLEESVRMCELASSFGCEAMIATPHQRHPTWWNTEPIQLATLLKRIPDTSTQFDQHSLSDAEPQIRT